MLLVVVFLSALATELPSTEERAEGARLRAIELLEGLLREEMGCPVGEEITVCVEPRRTTR